MAMYSPPTTPQLNPDIHEELLHRLDQEIQATQVRHDEAKKRLQHEQRERRRATTHEPLVLNQGQFENVDNTQNPWVHDYSFNLTGIVPPQPPKWKQVDHLYEDFKKFRRPCNHVFDGPMDHVSDKVKVNMLLLWCGPDGEDIYEGFNLDVHQQYDLELIWSLFDKHCKPICNFHAARWKFRTVTQAPSETLDTFYNRILKLAKQCQFEPAEEKSRLIDAIIYGTTISKAQEKLLQTPITLTLDQCLSICRHYESLKYHLETIKPRLVEYLQKRHNKSKGHGHGHGHGHGCGGYIPQPTAKPGTGRGRGTPTTGNKCQSCGKVHGDNGCPARNSVCFGCNKRGHFKTMCYSRKTQSWSHSSQQKVVQEVHTHEDQNTGKSKNVDIVEMMRSMGLRAKNPSQVVHEMSILHDNVKPVFYSPVQPEIVTTVWEQVSNVVDPEVCVATPVEHCVYETKQINVITVHDMELKSAHYSNVTINGQMVQVKQDTGAEVNVMSKCIFDKLSTNSTTRKSVLLNKTRTVKISGYGENLIEYIGTCVFKVSHNNLHKDVLFFITNVKDDEMICHCI